MICRKHNVAYDRDIVESRMVELQYSPEDIGKFLGMQYLGSRKSACRIAKDMKKSGCKVPQIAAALGVDQSLATMMVKCRS